MTGQRRATVLAIVKNFTMQVANWFLISNAADHQIWYRLKAVLAIGRHRKPTLAAGQVQFIGVPFGGFGCPWPWGPYS